MNRRLRPLFAVQSKNHVWLFVGGSLLFLAALFLNRPLFSDISLIYNGERTLLSQLTFQNEELRDVFEVEATYHAPRFSAVSHRIIPDEQFLSLDIDGQRADLSAIPPEKLSNWNSGFFIRLNQLAAGEHQLRFRLSNKNGPGGLRVHSRNHSADTILACAVGLLVFAMTIQMRLGRSSRIIITLAALLAAQYLLKTPYGLRSYDALAHLEYIQYIVQHHALPPSFGGWGFHQPPLYYLLMAPLFSCGERLALFQPQHAIQLFSLACWVAMIFVAERLLSHLLPSHRRWKSLLLALFAFWPSGIILSARIGNDPLLSLFSMIALWQTLLWWEKKEQRHYFWALIAASLALMTKASGLVPLAVLLFFTLLHLLQKRVLPLSRLSLIAILFIAFSVSFGRNLYGSLKGESHLLMGDSGKGMNRELLVGNNLSNYLQFDLHTFLHYPYLSVWKDEGGRQFFGNTLLRSSLSGEFDLGTANRFPSLLMGYSLLMIVIGSIVLLMIHWRKLLQPRWLPLWSSLLLYLIALIYFRASAPYACHNDFRLIFPALLPAIGLLSIGGIDNSITASRQGEIALRFSLAIPIVVLTLSSVAIWLTI